MDKIHSYQQVNQHLMNNKRVVLILWILLFVIFLIVFQSILYKLEHNLNFKNYIDSLNKEIDIQIDLQNKIKKELLKLLNSSFTKIPILLLTCDRKSFKRTLDQIINLRPNKEKYPIYVSFGCPEFDIDYYIKFYEGQINVLKHIPNTYDPNSKIPHHMWGYYKISEHYRFALSQIFDRNYEALLILEDDFDLSPDFFEYFESTYPLLDIDPTIWCISSWNDNGLSNLTIDDPELLYRSDFFPGLGWLLKKELWQELKPIWPKAFWDDWIRSPEVRKGRVCIRPEVSRVYTFGVEGVSSGQYYKTHLSKIMLNKKYARFNRIGSETEIGKHKIIDLIKENYDAKLSSLINNSIAITIEELLNIYPLQTNVDSTMFTYNSFKSPSYKLTYTDDKDFQKIAKTFGLMSDIRGNTSRTSYQGIVSFMLRGHQIFLVKYQDPS